MKKITQEDVNKDWGKVRKALDKAGKGAWDEALEKALEEALESERKFEGRENLK